ncbi:hypothetical protein [Pseudomonas phage GP100]|nr:hypothetical protein [Pseudomonas phage GP100]
MKSTFVVVKRGVYRHDLCGCHSNLEKAKALAEVAQHKEKDAYHDFEVVEVFYDGREELHLFTFTGKGHWELP